MATETGVARTNEQHDALDESAFYLSFLFKRLCA